MLVVRDILILLKPRFESVFPNEFAGAEPLTADVFRDFAGARELGTFAAEIDAMLLHTLRNDASRNLSISE